MEEIKCAFFGTSDFSLMVLKELEKSGFTPKIIVCGEDKPVGRKRVMTAPVVKVWGQEKNIPVLQPKKVSEVEYDLRGLGCQVFVLASYGKILPKCILDIPPQGTLNVHPSLLPKYRGASPLHSAILNENETGVSIILLTDKMDAGPILKQEKTEIAWPPYYGDLEAATARQGGRMLAEVIPQWLMGMGASYQDDELATYCKKVGKFDGYMDLKDPPELNLRKIRAYSDWPNAYYCVTRGSKNIKVVVKKARIENGLLVLERVVPEGSREMDYVEFARGLK